MEITEESLGSRQARSDATEGTGLRRFAINALSNDGDDENENVVWKGLKNSVGFAVSKIKEFVAPFLEWSATKFVGLIFSARDFLWNFNWNIQPEEANEKIQALLAQLAGQVGGALGQATGYAVCGALPGVVMLKFNPAMGAFVLKKVGEEALEEIGSTVGNLIVSTIKMGSAAAFVWAYANVKNFFRENMDAIGDAKLLEAGMTPAKLEELRKDRKKPWSFASAYEEWLDGIKNPIVRNFVEEFGEEFSDSCRDAAYIVASAAEQFAVQNQVSMDAILGEETTVEILLNRQADEAIA
ncbi:hypothetical protein NDI44_08705 [Trichocoleus sp. DQ-A3]|uniref:hypothetical protein n=1 Tax=Cyanophyceae TaxID=3028117 RepID=UPI0016823FDE|nr:hypothetical protein [Coleofasciculus sp. FACHB-125]MBD1899271.1 hypothetical protein [Coleofasciculus sp. FACHB-125]